MEDKRDRDGVVDDVPIVNVSDGNERNEKKRKVEPAAEAHHSQQPLIGAAGAEFVKNWLSKAGPMVTIREIQQAHGLTDVVPVLDLLDMHGVKRSAVYLELIHKLKENLLPRLQALSQAQLHVMLEKTFPYISIDELGAIPLAVLMRLDRVDPMFLHELAQHKALYEKCPMKIKRHIWAVESALFWQQLRPLCEQYVSAALGPMDGAVNEIWAATRGQEEPRERRRQSSALTSIVQCIERSVQLYRSALDYCGQQWKQANEDLYCALRADVLMALHEANVTEIYTADTLHDYCWILDAAVREKQFSPALLKDLQEAKKKLKVGKDRTDRHMLLANPYVVHVVLRSCCSLLNKCVDERVLPSDRKRAPALRTLVGLLCDACETGDRRQSRRDVLALLCPWICSSIVDGCLQEGSATLSSASVVPQPILELVKKDVASRRLLHAAIVMRVEEGEPAGLSSLIQCAVDAGSLNGRDFVQSVATGILHGARGANATTTKWLLTQQCALMQLLAKVSSWGLWNHKQAMRALQHCESRMPVAHVLEFMRHLIQAAPKAHADDKELSLMYINVLEHLVPDKASDDEVMFVAEFLNLGGDDDEPQMEQQNEEQQNEEQQQQQQENDQ